MIWRSSIWRVHIGIDEISEYINLNRIKYGLGFASDEFHH